jgi:hypothetical protein
VPHGAYICPSTRRFPVASRHPHKLAVDSVFASSKRKPVGRRPTENNHVTPSHVRERSNGGVAPPRVRRTRNRKFPPNRPFRGRGKPRRLRWGGCHSYPMEQPSSIYSFYKSCSLSFDLSVRPQIGINTEFDVCTFSRHERLLGLSYGTNFYQDMTVGVMAEPHFSSTPRSPEPHSRSSQQLTPVIAAVPQLPRSLERIHSNFHYSKTRLIRTHSTIS